MGPPIERFTPRDLGKRSWGTEMLIALGPTYLGKIMRMTAGAAGGLQYHRQKDEAGIVWQGAIEVTHDDGTGRLILSRLEEGDCYHFPPGAVHRVKALNEVVIFEVSSPHFDDRVRVEHLYGEPILTNPDELPTTAGPTHG